MRIRKFNEALESVDLEYIRQCFADLLDSGVAEISKRSGNYVAVTILLPSMSMASKFLKSGGVLNVRPELISSDTSLGKVIEMHDNDNEVYQDIKIALQRLADEYPGYRIKVEHFSKLKIVIFS